MGITRSTVFERLCQLFPTGYLDLAKVLGGSLMRNLLRGIFKILLAGLLAPQAMGILRSTYAFFRITANLADFGLDHALVTFVSQAIGKGDRIGEKQILRTVLCLKLYVAVGFILVGFFFAPKIALWVLSDAGLTIYVRLSFCAVGGQLLWNYMSSYLSARQDFGNLSFFLVSAPFLMLLSALILIGLDRFSLAAGIVIVLFAPAVTAALWLPVLGRKLPLRPAWIPAAVRKIVRFSPWVYFSRLASSLRENINPLLLKSPLMSGSLAAGEASAGLYAFGSDLANEIAVISSSLFTVLLPKASGKAGTAELKRFLKKSYLHLAALIVPLALLIFLAKPMILVLAYFKTSYLDYLPSLKVFVILYAGALFTVASIPMYSVLYAMKLPQVASYIDLAMLFVLISGSLILIPRFGSNGAAIAVFVQRVLSFIIIMSYGWIALQKAEVRVT